MSKKNPSPGGRAQKKTEVSQVCSSAAEYLTVVPPEGQDSVVKKYLTTASDQKSYATRFSVCYRVKSAEQVKVMKVIAAKKW